MTDVRLVEIGAHRDAILALVLLDNMIVATGDERALEFWMDCVPSPEQLSLELLSDSGTALAAGAAGGILVGDASGKLIAVGADGEARVLRTAGVRVGSVALAPDGLRAVISDDKLRVWDLSQRAEVATISQNGFRNAVLAWSSDGRVLAAGHTTGRVDIFDAIAMPPSPSKAIRTVCGVPLSLAFSADGTRLVVGTTMDSRCRGAEDQDDAALAYLEVWTVDPVKLERRIVAESSSIASVAVSSRGVVAHSDAERVRLLDLKTGKLLAVLRDAKETIHTVAFSNDGEYLVTGSGARRHHSRPGIDNAIRLYSLAGAASLASGDR